MKRTLLAVLTAACFILSMAGPTLAVTSTGSVAESGISGPPLTVQGTVPASVLYTLGTKWDSAPILLTNVGTNGSTGMDIRMTTSVFSPGNVPTTVRSRDAAVQGATGCTSGWAEQPARAAGFYATSATVDTIDSQPGSTCSTYSVSFVMHATTTSFTQIGASYTGTLSISFVTT